MKAEIITIGDELLIGQIVDTNSAWIGAELNKIGIAVHQITSVSDNREHILTALHEASKRVSVVLITGGLGPTKDDITKYTLCDYFASSLIFNEEVYQNVERLFTTRGRVVTDINRKQAEVPVKCRVLLNAVGTAPGMWFEENEVVYVSMPGVPYEMMHIMKEHVLPGLQIRFKTPFIIHRTLLTQGIGESYLAEMIADFEDNLPADVKLAYLPSPGQVRLRLSATGIEEEIKPKMAYLTDDLSKRIEKYLYGFDDDKLEEIVGRLLMEKKLTVATAESCTGGYMAHMLTSVAGCSVYYMGSTITYSYESKTDLLNIPADLMKEHGAVSEEVVRAMTEGVCKLYNTHCAVATSGVAGPGGGTEQKPVGTVWVAVKTPLETIAKKLMLGDNRLRTIQVASMAGLNLLRKELLKI